MENIIIREPRTREEIDRATNMMLAFNEWLSESILPEQRRLRSIMDNNNLSDEEHYVAAIQGKALCDLVEQKNNEILSLIGFQNEDDILKWFETHGDLYYSED